MNQYRAINIKTGEDIQDSARNLFAKTGIFIQIIYKYAKTGEVYRGSWKFEKVK